jgi:hypothetical protein
MWLLIKVIFLLTLWSRDCTAYNQIILATNVEIIYKNLGNRTVFTVKSPLGSGVDVNNAWLGVGFNTAKTMVRTFYISKSYLKKIF